MKECIQHLWPESSKERSKCKEDCRYTCSPNKKAKKREVEIYFIDNKISFLPSL